MKINYQPIFQEIATGLNQLDDIGKVASYIPELANVDPAKLGAHLTNINNNHLS